MNFRIKLIFYYLKFKSGRLLLYQIKKYTCK